MNENDLIQVQVIGFSPAQQTGGFVVFLQEDGTRRCLPIVVGVAEAQAISLILNPEPLARPMTYDTFKNILDSLRGVIARVVVTKLEDNTFYADIWVTNATGDSFHLDARPSDSIAIALKNGAPIYVARDVMRAAGIDVPDQMLEKGHPARKATRLERLAAKLREALEEENYEEAARLRDEIKRAKAEDKGGGGSDG